MYKMKITIPMLQATHVGYTSQNDACGKHCQNKSRQTGTSESASIRLMDTSVHFY